VIRSDVAVLGAGIIGVSAALHLQARGRSVVLVDRRAPGEETSHGNAGLIERSSVVPYAFPRSVVDVLRYAANRQIDARYHWSFLPRIAPWLFQYWRQSSPARLAEAAQAMLPLIERCVDEHWPLMEQAGITHLARETGWIAAYRTARGLEGGLAEAEAAAAHALRCAVLDPAGLRAMEPHLRDGLAGAVHWLDPVSVSDPGAVTKGYADLFVRRGGRLVRGDARGLQPAEGGWALPGEDGRILARDVVVALGPWSSDVVRPLGYRIPLAVKRGYHIHYRPQGNAVLHRPVLDAESGYVLTPMARGLRLTTGIEMGPRDAAPTPVQLAGAEAAARTLFPLDGRVEDQPWMGARPCLPDMRPVIGPAPRHKGLWFAFGHAHHGFTLGPVTGRLIAEMLTGGETVVDPAPYRADRF
jgi:D-amino-acid dehydrogenase